MKDFSTSAIKTPRAIKLETSYSTLLGAAVNHQKRWWNTVTIVLNIVATIRHNYNHNYSHNYNHRYHHSYCWFITQEQNKFHYRGPLYPTHGGGHYHCFTHPPAELRLQVLQQGSPTTTFDRCWSLLPVMWHCLASAHHSQRMSMVKLGWEFVRMVRN